MFIVKVLLFSLLPALALVGASIIPAFRRPSSHIKSMIQHFAAGVVFSVAAVEFLPEIRHDLRPLPLAVTFMAGVVLMLNLELLTKQVQKLFGRHDSGDGRFLVAVAIDLSLDGLLLGIGFSVGPTQGLLLALALALEGITLGLAIATSLLEAGARGTQVFLRCSGLALLLVLGAGLGGTLLHSLSKDILAMVMSFGLAALLYLVTEELLVEAHEETDTPLASGMFFVGFLTFVILGMVL